MEYISMTQFLLYKLMIPGIQAIMVPPKAVQEYYISSFYMQAFVQTKADFTGKQSLDELFRVVKSM